MGKYLDASGVTYLWGKAKSTFAPISHTHGNISNDGKLSTASKAVVTDSTGAITTGDITNDMLANKSVTIAGNTVNLGESLDSSTLRSSLGISTAVYWAGVTTTNIDGDASTSSTIVVDGKSITVNQGAVAQKSGTSTEYIYNGTNWQVLGDEGSYALKTNTVNGLALSTNPDLYSTAGSTATVGHVLVLADTTNHKYKDSGFTIAKSVPADASFTDTVYVHPAAGSKSTTKSASGATGTAGSTVQVVTGVEIDASGHVTGVTSGAATDTVYVHPVAGAGSGVTTVGSKDITGASSAGQDVITGFNLDASGHVSSATRTTIYASQYVHPAAGSSAGDATATADSTATSAVVSVQLDASGHVAGVKTKSFSTIDTVTTATATVTTGSAIGSIKKGSDASVVFYNGIEKSSTNGNIKSAGSEIVVYTHPTAGEGSAATATAGTAAGKTVVTGVSIDASGHVSGVTTSDITSAYTDTITTVSATATTGDEIGTAKKGSDASVTLKNGMVALTNSEIDAAIVLA